jgi:hypothetical protein
VISFLWLLGAAGVTFWKRRFTTGLVFTGVLVIEGFFSHNLLEERGFLILFGLFLTLSFFSATEQVGSLAISDSQASERPRPRSSRTAARRPNARRTPPRAATSRIL